MNLPFLKNLPFLSKNEEKKEYFLSLIIKPASIVAILFEEINSRLSILSTKETDLKVDANEIGEEELIEAGDEVISFVETSIPGDSKLEKTIFSVPHDWIDEGKIKKEYLAKLKKFCQELGLAPIGFIMSIEAIVHHIQNKEGAPISSVFVEVSRKKAFIYLVRAGKILEVHSKEIDGEAVKTVEYLLRKIEKVDVLPAKIILLNYDGAEGLAQDFLSHTWSDEISFIHVPQVTVLEKGFENEAIVNGVASEMDLQVAFVKGNIVGEKESETILEEKALSEDFGFMQEQDLAKNSREESNSIEDENGAKVSYFQEQDVANEESKDPDLEEKKVAQKGISKVNNLKAIFTGINLSSIFQKINLENLQSRFFPNSKRSNSKLFIGGVAAIIMAIIFSFLYYSFIIRVDIVLSADKKTVDKTTDVSFATDARITSSTMRISLASEDVKGSDSTDATGKKEIGDKATGEVTIYNKTDSKKTFPKGTVIAGSSDLEFILLSEITIASTSAFSTGTPSNEKVKIEARDIGKEYNLPSDTNFIIGSFQASDYFAKNITAFSGGSKKEAKVVSKEDLNGLLESVKEAFLKKAMEQASKKIDGDSVLLNQPISIEVVDQSFDRKENEEADTLSLSATIRYKIGSYTKSDLEEYIKSLAQGSIPENYKLSISESNVKVEDLKIGKNDTATASLTVNAVYIPGVDEKTLKDKIKGKSINFAKSELEKINGVNNVKIEFKNALPFLPKLLPRSIKNINFSIDL